MAAFLASRILYHFAGIRFDASPVAIYWQYIDPVLMRTRLVESLFYLHMQPPGFNLAVGLVVKFFPSSYAAVLQIIYLILGVLIAFLLLHLMRLFRVPEWIAATLTVLFVVNPGCVLYENLAIYEYPILFLLLLAAIALFRFSRAPTVRHSLEFFALILALVLMRNQFHLLYVLFLAAALLAVFPRARRAVLVGALPVIALIFSLYLKNWILFHAFTASTWAGMATGVTTTFQLTPEEADRLVRGGVVTPLARIPPFSDLKSYVGYVDAAPATGIPVLDQAETSTGHANFNNPTYLKLHDLYLANSESIWLHYPVAYVRSVLIAWFAYFLPTSDMHSFDDVRPRIQSFDRFFSAVIFGQFRQADSRKDLRAIKAAGGALRLPFYTGTFLMVGLPLLILWASAQLALRRVRNRWKKEESVLLGFMLFTILFATAISNFLSSFENNRYRFVLDGYYTVIAGLAITALITARRPGRATRGVL
ncbi:MAG TPA: hypothetical protein VGR73_08495 [Bryobacteraceae bacterium]|nr:hypothetical protein [Bryobacteraceae bacterium]